MIKKLFISFSLVLSAQAFAQQGTASPYSFYGVGDLSYNGTNEYKAMGGTSVFSDSIHLNLKNPATLSQLKTTTFTLGATGKFYTFKSDTNSDNIKRQTFDYISLAFPVSKKVGVAFGLQPYSNTGYKIDRTNTNELGQQTFSLLEGNGGLNRVFVSSGYEISKSFQFGVQFGYLFGNTYHDTTLSMLNAGDGFGLSSKTNESRRIEFKGYDINASLQYMGKIKNYDFQANLTYNPETKLTAHNTTNLKLINTAGYVIDTSEVINEEIKTNKPQEFSFGAGIGKNQKWFIAGQFTYIENSKLSNKWNTSSYASFEDTKRFSVGGFYIPKYNSFTSYFDRVVYRAGFKYENTGLILKNESINDYSVSVGAGLPMFGRTLSNINLALEYGGKGTKNNGLIKENYFNVSIGLSFNDFWFVKRRFE